MLSHENIMAATCASILQVKHVLVALQLYKSPFPHWLTDLLTLPFWCKSWKRIFHPDKPRIYGDAVPYCSMRDGTDMGNVSQDVRKSVREVVGWRDAFASKNYFITDWSCSWESMRLGGRTSSSPFCPWPTPSRSAASSPPSSGPKILYFYQQSHSIYYCFCQYACTLYVYRRHALVFGFIFLCIKYLLWLSNHLLDFATYTYVHMYIYSLRFRGSFVCRKFLFTYSVADQLVSTRGTSNTWNRSGPGLNKCSEVQWIYGCVAYYSYSLRLSGSVSE